MKPWDVFVTGSSGFVGRYMVAELESRGHRVFTCDLKEGNNLLDTLPKMGDDLRFDLVVHLAYHVGGRAAIDGSPMNLAANLQLDAALFDWALRTKQKRVLYFSSSAAYPTKYQSEYDHRSLVEHDIRYGDVQEPDANYGWAKLTGERMALAAIASGLKVYIVRPFSGYAQDQDLDYPFPMLIRRVRRHEDPINVWGSEKQVRDWIHITDVVNGSLAVVDQDVDEPVNLCTGIGTSMEELIRTASRHAGYDPAINVQKSMPMGVFYRVGDPNLMDRIYWPKVPLEIAVSRAMRWTPPAGTRP